jgi:hypothetical protein
MSHRYRTLGELSNQPQMNTDEHRGAKSDLLSVFIRVHLWLIRIRPARMFRFSTNCRKWGSALAYIRDRRLSGIGARGSRGNSSGPFRQFASARGFLLAGLVLVWLVGTKSPPAGIDLFRRVGIPGQDGKQETRNGQRDENARIHGDAAIEGGECLMPILSFQENFHCEAPRRGRSNSMATPEVRKHSSRWTRTCGPIEALTHVLAQIAQGVHSRSRSNSECLASASLTILTSSCQS